MMLSGCSTTQAVHQSSVPPAETMVRMQNPPVFQGKRVNDVVEAYLDLLAQYKQGQIRHNELVDWINKELVNANDRIR